MSASEFCTRQKIKIFYTNVIDRNIRVIKASRMISAPYMANMGERRRVNSVFGGKPPEKRSIGRPRH
jgi:hypothetical protein